MRSLVQFARFLLLAWLLIAAASARAEPVLGDWDQDGDRDLADFAALANCQSTATPSDLPACGLFQFSPDPEITTSDFRLFTCGFGGPGVVVRALTADQPTSPTAITNVVLTGTTAGSLSVQVTGGANTVTLPTDGCDFAVLVELRPNVVNPLFVTGLFGNGAASAPLGVSITHDAQAPNLFIDFPAANTQITTASTDVAGRVGDTLSGFTGMTVTVVVNGRPPVPALVDIGIGPNGTFFAPGLPLDLGENIIAVTALDGLGNGVEKQITVTRPEIPAGTPQMHVLSGNGQSAPIHAALPQPIRVEVVSAKGAPLPGKLVTFNVVRSDGRLAANTGGLFPGASMLQVFTDAQGIARAFWRLGGDAGRGNNRVEVVSGDVIGTTFFCASATAGPATQINIGGGNNQRAQAGASAPEPLSVWVNDSCNPVAGIAVTFTVRQGGGKVNGADAVNVETNPTGHAEVSFVLGAQGGNNVIEAGFPGSPNPPAVFTIFGVVRDAKVPTSFSGLVLDNAGQPIQGATCALVLGGVTLPFVHSDLDGRFLFDDIPGAGPADIHVAGASATHVGGADGVDVPPNSFPALRFSTIIVPNAANSLASPVLLPRLDPANLRSYSTTQDTELTVAGMDGLKMIVKAGSMKIRIGGPFLPAPNGTAISLNQVHHDDVPMPLPDGAAPPFAWTLQPGGAHFDPPVTIIYPNMSGLPAGAIANFLSFNNDTGKFEIIASGHVSEDGATIVSDPGAGISVAGWGCNCPPYSVTGECCHCNQCQRCQGGLCFPDGIPCGSGCCAEGQSCCEGTCVSPDVTCCEGGSTCPADETCCGSSCCLEGEECCENGCCRADQQCCGLNCIDARNICCDNGTECFPPEFPMCCGTSCCVADGVCCDDECQIPGSTCCSEGHVCSPPTPGCCGENCCAEGGECCNGVCAPEGTRCCDQADFCPSEKPQCCVETCCTSDQLCCDGVCAPSDAVCCEGPGFCPSEKPQCCENECCPADGVCCNGACKASGSVCCDDGVVCTRDEPICCHGGPCCAAEEVCCEDGCNPANTTCCGDHPCTAPTPQCCGSGCCQVDEVCCGTVPCCPAGTSCCDDSTCCASDEQCCEGACFPTAGGACCPGANCPSKVCCGDACCDAGQECCNDACSPFGTCCSDGRPFCGDVCCSAGAVCCSGTCTPENQCCSDGRPFCGDLCCNAGAVCCSGTCTPANACCSDGRPFCGDLCCNAGAVCCSGVCTPANACCSDGRPFCGDLCCNASASCCNGQCRAAGQPCP